MCIHRPLRELLRSEAAGPQLTQSPAAVILTQDSTSHLLGLPSDQCPGSGTVWHMGADRKHTALNLTCPGLPHKTQEASGMWPASPGDRVGRLQAETATPPVAVTLDPAAGRPPCVLPPQAGLSLVPPAPSDSRTVSSGDAIKTQSSHVLSRQVRSGRHEPARSYGNMGKARCWATCQQPLQRTSASPTPQASCRCVSALPNGKWVSLIHFAPQCAQTQGH